MKETMESGGSQDKWHEKPGLTLLEAARPSMKCFPVFIAIYRRGAGIAAFTTTEKSDVNIKACLVYDGADFINACLRLRELVDPLFIIGL